MESSTDLARHFSIAFRGLHSRRLMPSIYEFDTALLRADEKRIEMSTMHAKGHFDTKMSQGLGEEVASEELALGRDLRLEFDHGGECRERMTKVNGLKCEVERSVRWSAQKDRIVVYDMTFNANDDQRSFPEVLFLPHYACQGRQGTYSTANRS